MRERSSKQEAYKVISKIHSLYEDAIAALELLGEGEAEMLVEAEAILSSLVAELDQQEFFCKMNQPHDRSDAIIEINGGSGGTDAQDWAEMLYRMYARWAEAHGFGIEEIDKRPGEAAGIKNVTLVIEGDFAYGHLRSEQGVHRLVRISPFDSGARRHTSFASVTVTPDIEEDVEVEIDEKDLRVDTYRSSGAGGQHVNKTDSAVRLTHIPTGIVVACQNERSQHKNKDRAMKILRAKLYELEEQKKAERLEELKGERKSIDYGSQIRSYVLHPFKLVKDLRTGFETSDPDSVLDGNLDPFIQSYLLSARNRRVE